MIKKIMGATLIASPILAPLLWVDPTEYLIKLAFIGLVLAVPFVIILGLVLLVGDTE